jgi:branched-chain amino acid transport system ATP-binding protein
MAEPQVLLLDEPSSGLAPAIVDGIYVALRSLRDQGIGVLVVEQNLERALRESDRCYVVEQGRVVLHGASGRLDADRVASIVLGVEAADAGSAGPL